MTVLSRTTVKPAELTLPEQTRKKELESTVREGFSTFVAVGNALSEIRDQRLYRDEFSTFAEYCRQMWGISEATATRKILAATFTKSVPEELPAPASEYSVRPLSALPESEKVDAYREAVNQSGGVAPTKAVVEKVVDAARSKGIIPPKSEVIVDEPIDADDPEEPPAPVGPLTDEQYLESLPARAKLTGSRRDHFDADALCYRHTKEARDEYREACLRHTRAAEKATKGHIGRWLQKHKAYFRIQDPTRWLTCTDCKGEGTIASIGSSVQECPTCKGHGYHVY